jgi:hypothetical protein
MKRDSIGFAQAINKEVFSSLLQPKNQILLKSKEREQQAGVPNRSSKQEFQTRVPNKSSKQELGLAGGRLIRPR